MKKFRYSTNINCENCLMTVTPFLNGIDTIEQWHVDLNHEKKILEVALEDDDTGAIVRAVEEAGFNIEPMEISSV